MKYDFDKIIERTGTHSVKWDSAERKFGLHGVLPMWVADMDFEAPWPVVEALRKRVEHGVYGYSEKPESCIKALVSWMKKRFAWEVEEEWIVFTPGVMAGVCMAIQSYTNPGDGVIIQPPVYYPFHEVIQDNQRIVVENPLIIQEGRYVMDCSNLESVIDDRSRMLILCSPHNPVGRVWSKEELKELVEICLRNDLVLVSDEIHADLIMKGYTHTATAALSPEVAGITVTCNAPTKSFNLAGLEVGYAIIPQKKLRLIFQKKLRQTGLMLSNMFGMVALETAYSKGEEWLEELLEYVRSNYLFLRSFIDKFLPKVTVFPMEGTYLAWLDFRKYGIPDKKLKELLLHEAKIWLVEGPKFGAGGAGFQRMNIACPRKTLEEGLDRLAGALNK